MRLIFVFGSNLAGRHGKGAALDAAKYYNAIYGQGEGLQGDAYAIPTKDAALKPLPLGAIEINIRRFLSHAYGNPKNYYMVTPIGTGLAGYSKREIAGIFRSCTIPENVLFTKQWFE